MNTSRYGNLDDETLARAALTYCSDGADAAMYATIMGAGSAAPVFDLLEQLLRSDAVGRARVMQELDRFAARGVTTWGGKWSSRSMTTYHQSVETWRTQAATMPSTNFQELASWLSCAGTQWIIAPHSEYWPKQLDDLAIRNGSAAPLCLWGLGDPQALMSCARPVSVVGSRGVNAYGRRVAHDVAFSMCRSGHLVVSGGAFGADAAAHWGAIDAAETFGEGNAGRTVAVFAGGLSRRGPQRNEPLFQQIIRHNGALISELPPNIIAHPGRFLKRNRIIAALCFSVVVAQARLRSGALNTAHWAGELGRDVYAAPGDITMPSNAGCNALIEGREATILCSTTGGACAGHGAHRPDASDTRSMTESGHTGKTEGEHAGGANDDYSTQAVGCDGNMETRIMQLLTHGHHIRRGLGMQEIIDACSPVEPGSLTSTDEHTPEVMQALSVLELSGKITAVHGTVKLATGTASDQRPSHHRPHAHDPPGPE